MKGFSGATWFLISGIGERRWGELTTQDVDSLIFVLLNMEKISPTTVIRVRTLLYSAMKYVEKEGIVGKNVVTLADHPKPDHHHFSVYDTEELKQLIFRSRGDDLFIPILLAAPTAYVIASHSFPRPSTFLRRRDARQRDGHGPLPALVWPFAHFEGRKHLRPFCCRDAQAGAEERQSDSRTRKGPRNREK